MLLHKRGHAYGPVPRPALLQVHIAAGIARKHLGGAPYTSSHAQRYGSSTAQENVKNPGALTSRDNKCC
jgi:hypothetical protein